MPRPAAKLSGNSDGSSDEQPIDDWVSLRQLLLSKELAAIESLRNDLDLLRNRIDDPEQRTKDLSEVLTAATVQNRDASGEFSAALRPIVEAEFRATARENPEVMAEALFPVLGPAIRKMIASLFKFDASGAGKLYSIEQIFLIDKITGLPIVHAVHEKASAQDADMVSGMLSAIQSYVQEAFSTSSFDNLNTLELGELSVWIEWGPNAVLASVIRGIAPESFRHLLQEWLESIHKNNADRLRSYDGDSAGFETVKNDLNEFLNNPHLGKSLKASRLTPKQRKWAWRSAAPILALAVWFGHAKIDEHRWQGYIETLKTTPGIIVINDSRGFGRYNVKVLQDPLAQDPLKLLEEFPIDKDAVSIDLSTYQTLHPDIVLKRAISLLNPPDTATMDLNDGKLIVRGSVTSHWLNNARQFAPLITGVDSIIYRLNLLPSER